jgi:putative exosortase-associated protein (TIGR04073 family)
MKIAVMLIMCLTLTVMESSFAEATPAKKLYRGAVNILTAPIEVPKQARAYWIKGAQITPHILAWIASGTVWGVVQTVKRAGSGIWDVVTFPFEKPEKYEPLLQPDYVFQEWPRNPVSGR